MARVHCHTSTHVTSALTGVIHDGGEGLILRRFQSFYNSGRSTDLVKLKVFLEQMREKRERRERRRAREVESAEVVHDGGEGLILKRFPSATILQIRWVLRGGGDEGRRRRR